VLIGHALSIHGPDGSGAGASITGTAKPRLARLTLRGFAPTVVVEVDEHVTVEPGYGELTYQGFAPDVIAEVDDPVTVEPGLGECTYAGWAPTVVWLTIQRPGLGQATYTGLAPTVVAQGNVWVLPPMSDLELVGLRPRVITPIPTGLATYTGFAPTVIAEVTPYIPSYYYLGF
jgi:hypothetical protein